MTPATEARQRTCLIIQPIHQAGLDLLAAAGIRPLPLGQTDAEAVMQAAPSADAVITRNAGFSAAAIAAAPNLRVIAVHGVGTDAVAIPAATERGIAVVNTPGANTQAVAEQVIALTLALVKAVPQADAAVRSGDVDFKYAVRLRELRGARFGVVGFGAIGRATARLAAALGMKVLVYSRSEVVVGPELTRTAELDALLRDSDVVSLHLPLTPETRGLIGPRQLAAMKPGAYLVNTARGALVDEVALVEALRSGRIAGAGLDVFEIEPLATTSPLCSLPNVILSPHLAGSTVEAMERMAAMAAGQVVDVLSGRRPDHLVNSSVWKSGGVRP